MENTKETRVGYATLAAMRDIYSDSLREAYDLGMGFDLDLAARANRLALLVDYGFFYDGVIR